MSMDKGKSSPEEHSPLDESVLHITTDQVQPLVVFLWDRATELAQTESREVLAEMFLTVIATVSRLILDAFRNIVLEGGTREPPLQVSEQAVVGAVQVGLSESFHSVLGSTHQSINTLCSGLIVEVTSNVNAVLDQSQVQNKRLVVPDESTEPVYTPPKEHIKHLVRHARKMLRSCLPTKELTHTQEPLHLPPDTRAQKTGSPAIPHSPQPEDRPEPSRRPRIIRATLGQYTSVGYPPSSVVPLVPPETDRIESEAPVPPPDVPRHSSSKRTSFLLKPWSSDNCNDLVDELVSKIFQKTSDPLSVDLSRDLLAQLEDQVSQWDVVVKPCKYKDVASAVYKDLCKGRKKRQIKHAAIAQRGFSAKVLDAVHHRLTEFPRKRT